MARRRGDRRRALDEWFPTVAKYAGILVGAYGVLVDRGKNPYLFPFAGVLFGFKSIVEHVKGRDDKPGDGKDE